MKLKWQINDEEPIIKELDDFDLTQIKLCLMPSANVAEVKYGYWKRLNNDPVNHPMDLLCSECRYISYMRTNFCPHCGANMEGWRENK